MVSKGRENMNQAVVAQVPKFAQDLVTMMSCWDKVHAVVKEQFPKASPELQFHMTSSTFRAALGWGSPKPKPAAQPFAAWAKE
jgi:hypothetical protein